MSLESFYGGKQGVSPVIRTSFKYVSKDDPAYKNTFSPKDEEVMETCFANPNYTDVWYGELAIIDAENRSNPNHGRLYRRTLNRSNTNDKDTAHAEYIGTLAGPAVGFPQTEIYNFSDIKNGTAVAASFSSENLYIYPDETVEGGIARTSFESDEELTEAIKNASPLVITPKSPDFISGKDEDNIKYYWVNVVNNTIEDSEEKTALYLGFQIPYPVFDFNIKSVDWTENFSAKEIKKEGDEQSIKHPFYKNTELSIPIGVRGNSVSNFRKIKVGTEYSEPIYNYDTFHFLDNGLLDTNHLPAPINSTLENKYVWLYDFTAYGKFDNTTFSKEFSCYLGNVEEVEKVEITKDGRISIKYFNEEAENINENYPIKYIEDVQYNANNGTINVTYNTGSSQEFSWPGLSRLIFDESTGQLRYRLNNSSTVTDNAGTITAIYDAEINPQTQELTFKKFNGTNDPTTVHFEPKVFLKNIESVNVDPNGYLRITYTTTDENGIPTVDKFLITKPTQGIAAEIYRDRLEAIGILQDKYYRNDEDKTILKIFKKIENNTISPTEAQSLMRNNIFWGLEKKYFNIETAFDSLINNFPLTLLNSNDEREKYIYTIDSDKIDFYPYKDGQIPYFNQNEINTSLKDNSLEEWAIAILTTTSTLQDVGKIIYCNNSGFYYDFNTTFWNYAGSWNDSSNLSHIKIKYHKNGEAILIGDSEMSPKGFYFEQMDIGEKQKGLLFQSWNET